ncbi:RluA family pseudouridine synthase [Anaerotalea alkaliphila]|uniref:Pseudouridine synthase n=1 Tax=Anaerotalea alkaliphila TaxID=2662126 RepID=A0A7X5HXX8_9FIRM|nr:RluA family pseudouridine synthase [Anaerotalea alkaliphila]NDL68697.1 RluA family pseudouridine synthase [Anaerotalea alkaliphila]
MKEHDRQAALRFRVEAGQGNTKLKDFLKGTGGLSGRLLKKAAKAGGVLVNGRPAPMDRTLEEGDRVEVRMEERGVQSFEPQPMELAILYEDRDILVVEKPPFLLVHPTPNHPAGTLANGILHHLRREDPRAIVRLVGRLDRDTSGLVLVAKDAHAHMRLSEEGAVEEKAYLALVHGRPDPPQGTYDQPIGKSPDDPVRRQVLPGGRESRTRYQVLGTWEHPQAGEVSLVSLTLETGRTHQIRVHLSHGGHPLLGDPLYGIPGETVPGRQALHCHRLVLRHPRTGEQLGFESPLPPDLGALLPAPGSCGEPGTML